MAAIAAGLLTRILGMARSSSDLEQWLSRRAELSERSEIDAKIWQEFGETMAMLVTDLCGFTSGVVKHGIVHFLQLIHQSKNLLLPIAITHGGTLLKVEGDSLLLLFPNPVHAVAAAVAMQRAIATANTFLREEDRVLLSCGLGYGTVLRVGDSDVFGAEVNAAYVLGEDHANAYEILMTDAVRDAVPGLELVELEEIVTGPIKPWRLAY
ncbi:MAG: adenylate cyclase [Thermoanaerobaculia bacterium]|nr:adenylate cyclase [Thermoanaerobaculia bacterium]